MKLPFNQLAATLERDLAPLYLIAADEPLLVVEAGDLVRAAARAREFHERETHYVERGFRWDRLLGGADSLSLFSDKRIVEIRMPAARPGVAGAAAIRELAENADPDRLIIISIQSRLDRKQLASAWAKAVEKHGVVVQIRPVARHELPRFIVSRARQKGLSISPDAADLLAERVEGNLLAADQELAKLALIRETGSVDAEAVLEAVSSSARFDVFRLGDALVSGDSKRALKVLAGLKAEGAAPQLVLWALAREIQLLSQLDQARARGENLGAMMSRLRIWESRQGALRRAIDRYDAGALTRLVKSAAHADRVVKGLERAPAWEAVTGLLLDAVRSSGGRQAA